MASNSNKTAIVAAIIGIAGLILVTAISLALAHSTDSSIHPERKNVITKPEFDQFQERIFDGINDLKKSQRQLGEDIRDIQRRIPN